MTVGFQPFGIPSHLFEGQAYGLNTAGFYLCKSIPILMLQNAMFSHNFLLSFLKGGAEAEKIF